MKWITIKNIKFTEQFLNKNTKEYIEYLLKAQSEVVVSAIKEDICNIDESIVEWQDDIDTWSDVERNLIFYLETLGNNEDDWELVYKNS